MYLVPVRDLNRAILRANHENLYKLWAWIQAGQRMFSITGRSSIRGLISCSWASTTQRKTNKSRQILHPISFNKFKNMITNPDVQFPLTRTYKLCSRCSTRCRRRKKLKSKQAIRPNQNQSQGRESTAWDEKLTYKCVLDNPNALCVRKTSRLPPPHTHYHRKQKFTLCTCSDLKIPTAIAKP